MAKQANRGHGGKKNSKLLVREASVNCVAELSEADENCESLDHEDAISELEGQKCAGSVSALEVSANGEENSGHYEMENSGVHEVKKEPAVVVPDEKKNITQDWRQLFCSE
jgi:hypothetical protein